MTATLFALFTLLDLVEYGFAALVLAAVACVALVLVTRRIATTRMLRAHRNPTAAYRTTPRAPRVPMSAACAGHFFWTGGAYPHPATHGGRVVRRIAGRIVSLFAEEPTPEPEALRAELDAATAPLPWATVEVGCPDGQTLHVDAGHPDHPRLLAGVAEAWPLNSSARVSLPTPATPINPAPKRKRPRTRHPRTRRLRPQVS